MRARSLLVPLAALAAPLLAASAASAECVREGPTGTYCLFRSLLPSTGIVAHCVQERGDCRVGYYYGDPAKATWIAPPPEIPVLPMPEVTWITLTLAQVRFGCGAHCSESYFFEAKRRRLLGPRRDVMAVDALRGLVATAAGRALVVRVMSSGRELARIERDWAPGPWLGDAITELRFDPDGRMSFTWLRGAGREPVSERVSISTVPR